MKPCFGQIYPDLSRIAYNRDLAGKVFRLRINSLGILHQAPELKADLGEWEECQQCEHYRSCYDFSAAKLALQRAAAQV
jgi:hypothetical protein